MITLEIDASQPTQALNIVGQNLGDMAEPISQILKSALSDARMEVEAAKGGLFGATWQPMSSFTAAPPAFLQRIGIMHAREPGSLLLDRGSLAESLSPGGPGNILRATATEGTAGTNSRAGVLQQEGTSRTFDVMHYLASRGRVRRFVTPGIPARPFLGWHEERLPDYDKMLTDKIFRGVEGT